MQAEQLLAELQVWQLAILHSTQVLLKSWKLVAHCTQVLDWLHDVQLLIAQDIQVPFMRVFPGLHWVQVLLGQEAQLVKVQGNEHCPVMLLRVPLAQLLQKLVELQVWQPGTLHCRQVLFVPLLTNVNPVAQPEQTLGAEQLLQSKLLQTMQLKIPFVLKSENPDRHCEQLLVWLHCRQLLTLQDTHRVEFPVEEKLVLQTRQLLPLALQVRQLGTLQLP